jgi:hypothetical protein
VPHTLEGRAGTQLYEINALARLARR